MRTAVHAAARHLARAAANRPHSSSSSPQHWLDARAPRLQAWLASKARALWMRGLAERCGQHPQALGGHEALLERAVAARADALIARHASPWGDDNRGFTHLQTAALAAATGDAVAPFLRDDAAALALVADAAGGRATPLARSMLKMAARVSRDPLAGAVKRLRGVLADRGAAARGTVAPLACGGAELRVTGCAYHAVMSDDGGGHASPSTPLKWLPAVCCSADAAFFDGLEPAGVRYTRVAWLGGGDAACVARLTRA
jgi:hypothetical protein